MAGGNGRHHFPHNTPARARWLLSQFTAVLIIIAAVAVYLNIGWAIGAYHGAYIIGHAPQTFWQQVWAGWGGFLAGGLPAQPWDQILIMFLWPLLVLLALGSWVVYGLYWLSWLIFAGGIAKLLGAG